MQHDTWHLDNQWLNDFSETLVRDTHRLINELSIEVESDCVVVRGDARSYYSVQLAIHAAQTFGQVRPRFAETILLLSVGGQSLELNVTHATEPTHDAEVSTGRNARRRELTLAPV
ncbi:hypothetical protein CKO51_28365 [Rhodopirellula sp. SM50]|nr:hypothetical protein [Rhodopirellula sp. SM50]PAY16120.1 hypothetical protein CKO51_28365 [Rhodopirellula sp. SM50]